MYNEKRYIHEKYLQKRSVLSHAFPSLDHACPWKPCYAISISILPKQYAISALRLTSNALLNKRGVNVGVALQCWSLSQLISGSKVASSPANVAKVNFAVLAGETLAIII